jgi:hypothetical protein
VISSLWRRRFLTCGRGSNLWEHLRNKSRKTIDFHEEVRSVMHVDRFICFSGFLAFWSNTS